MFKDIKAVVFDVDGTLVDSMWIWHQVDIEFLGRRGHEVPADLQKAIEGSSYTETAIYFKERFKLTESVDEIKEEWRVLAEDYYRNKIIMKRGASEFIRVLHNKGIRLGIATSNSRELVEYMLDRHNIRSFFDVIRTSCEVEKGKPYPDVYLKAAEDLNILPEHCLVFEDTVAGATAAVSAGMRLIVVQDEASKCSREKLEEMSEKYIEDYYSVIEILNQET